MKRNEEQQSNIMVLTRKDVFVLKDEPVRNWGMAQRVRCMLQSPRT